MGLAIEKMVFEAEDYTAFDRRVRDNLKAMEILLQNPDFGQGAGSFGAELEMYIIDADGKPLGKNREIQLMVDNPQLTLELNRFNLEYNLTPFPVADRPFSNSEQALLKALQEVREAAAHFGGRIVPIGILPTLSPADFNAHTMTDVPRYHALAERLKKDRGGLFTVQIEGPEQLRLESNDITLEGANTSFQIHYRVAPAAFADTFNAVQLITPLVLALASNSPTLFGKRLWHETRVPLFKKSIDARKEQLLMNHPWHQPPRVNFGYGWVREGALELFAESVYLYPCLLPICGTEDSSQVAARGDIPLLHELRLQQSTVWLWNRPIYDHLAGGHLRIEMRAMPSGPSVADMMANAALAIGLTEGLRPNIKRLVRALPFSYANYNFYRAAEHGIHSKIIWPDPAGSELTEQPVLQLLKTLLPFAQQGLESIGVARQDIDRYLGIIERRLAACSSGAQWQLNSLETHGGRLGRAQACHAMLERYHQFSAANLPVAEWDT
ncbi:MAG: hypothetical protein RLZZ385_1024 [Pseudomonadota bacterium]|jgi:gamma-glutamyl:cysteine ligase YbdK (ATP-grasp superfamily)